METPPDSELITTPSAIALALAAAMLIALASVAMLWWRRRRKHVPRPAEAPAFDLAALGTGGPPPGAAVLELYHVPVRLAAIVLAPVGRGSELPATETLSSLLDSFLPGLARVIREHGTRIKLWPPQLSTQGFANALFAHVRLPGGKAKGSPWCIAAGRLDTEGRALLAGMLLCAAVPNNLGQFTFERQAQWLDAMRVKS